MDLETAYVAYFDQQLCAVLKQVFSYFSITNGKKKKKERKAAQKHE